MKTKSEPIINVCTSTRQALQRESAAKNRVISPASAINNRSLVR